MIVRFGKKTLLTAVAITLSACGSINADQQPSYLVNVALAIPSIFREIAFASNKNCFGKQLYPCSKCYLRKGTIEKLKKVQEELLEMGYSLKVWNAYCPSTTAKIFHDFLVKRKQAYNPQLEQALRSCRGACLDVTLVTKNGNIVPMPSGFGDATTKALRTNVDLPYPALRNRQLLDRVMIKNGFSTSELWWHFDDVDWKKYDMLDIPFDDLG